LAGLLSGIERKNCWWLAEHAGHRRPQQMQRLLRKAVWDADQIRDDVRGLVVEALGRPGDVIRPRPAARTTDAASPPNSRR